MADGTGDIQIELAGGRSARAYARVPSGSRRGMVVIHEVYGPQPEIDAVVDRFAGQGYAAIAPDCFDGRPMILCVRRVVMAMREGRGPVVDVLEAARAWLEAQAALPRSSVGLIGFCMGGGFALAAGAGWGAVSTNYGDVPPEKQLRGIGPVIGCYGARDRIFAKTGEVLSRRLTRLGVPHEAHVFDGVGHSFLTDGHHPVMATLSRPVMHIGYNAAVAEEAWGKITGFFEKHLPAAR